MQQLVTTDTFRGAREAYQRLLYEFTKRPLTIEDAEFLSFLAHPFNNNSLALEEGQPSQAQFLYCAKTHKPLEIPYKAFRYLEGVDNPSENKASLLYCFTYLCQYVTAFLHEHPLENSPLDLDGCCYTPTFDGLVDYPSLLSQGMQEGFTWVKDPRAVHSLVKGATFQRSLERYTFDNYKFKYLPYCYVDYGEVVDHAKAGDKVWMRKLFSQHSCVVIEFTGEPFFNFKGACAVLQGIHWYAFKRDEDRPEYLLNNGATRFAKTHVILSSPNTPFEGLDVSKLSSMAKFFESLKKPASPANLLNIKTYDCKPITHDFSITARCVGLPTWFAQIATTLSTELEKGI